MDDTGWRTEDRGRSRPGRLGSLVRALVWAALAAACGDKNPGPNEPIVIPDLMCPAAQVALCAPGAMSVAQDASSDGTLRSAPALENAAARTAISERLAQLNSALAANNVTKTRTALTDTRSALNAALAQLSSFPGDAADLTAIELLLDHIASLAG